MPRLVGQRDVEGENVDPGHELVEVVDEPGRARRSAAVVEHGHTEASGPAGDGPADAAVTDDAERRSVHVAAEAVEQAEARPPAPA